MKSSSATSALSNPTTKSESIASAVTFACDLADVVTFLVTTVGRRKDAEVAGRAGMRDDNEADTFRDIEDTRPVAVAGRDGRAVGGGFFVGPAVGVGTTRIACPRLEGPEGAGCFGGRGAGIAVARARDVAATSCAPLITRPER